MEQRLNQIKNLDFSKLHRYSNGLVIEDNLNNDFTIKVYPSEKLFNLGDDLNNNKTSTVTIPTKSVDIKPTDKVAVFKDGKEVISLDKTKYILANWLNKSNPNRITPPNVCKGEVVILYRYSNTDEFFWEAENTDLSLRKEDHVVYTFSDKPNLDDTEDPIEDRYTFTFSPKTNTISLHTTDKYGEYTTYDINLKTKDGYFELVDGKGNLFKLDSTKDHLRVHLEGSAAKYDLNIHGDDGYVELSDNKKNSLKLDSVAGSLTTNINKSITANTIDFNVNCTNYNVVATNYNIETSAYNLTSSNNTISSSNTSYVGGIITHDGNAIGKTHVHTSSAPGVDSSTPH